MVTPPFFESVDNALASTRRKMSSRPAFANSAFYGSGHLGDSFSSPPLGHSSFIETPRRMIHRPEQDSEREQELAILARQQRTTDDRVQSLLDRFSNIEGALKDLTNNMLSTSEANGRNSDVTVGYKKLPRGISVSSIM